MKNKKPIAMRCDKEQFKAIKPKLEKAKIEIKNISDNFGRYCYLVNNYIGKRSVSNVSVLWIDEFNRIVHEQWNEKVFLEACGIDTEPEYVITKDQLLQLKGTVAEKWFPEFFEVKLEVGKWYKKDDLLCLINFIDAKGRFFQRFHCYGFNTPTGYNNFCFDVMHDDCHGFKPATPQEVEQALKNEAVRRGFVEGVYFQVPNSLTISKCENEIILNPKNNSILYYGDYCIFKDGIWASIIPTKTKEEAEKLLNCKIV